MIKLTLFLLALSKQESIIFSFGSVVLFFLILLISGIRKTRKLNEENRKLMESIDMNLKDTPEKKYHDFTEYHSYRNDS